MVFKRTLMNTSAGPSQEAKESPDEPFQAVSRYIYEDFASETCYRQYAELPPGVDQSDQTRKSRRVGRSKRSTIAIFYLVARNSSIVNDAQDLQSGLKL